MGAVFMGEPPGSMDLLSGFAQRVDIPSHSIFVALKTLIPECWSGNPEERPSSSKILDRLTFVDLGNRDQPPGQVPEGISQTVEDIGRCLSEDCERGLGTVLNHPPPENDQRMNNTNTRTSLGGHKRHYHRPTDGADHPAGGGRCGSAVSPDGAAPPPPPGNPANLRTLNISIPSDMVGCIIGKSGSKITEIRRLSGCKITIAKVTHHETGERMITIVGSPEANENALFLLYNQMEKEKETRVGRVDAGEQ
ncbi:RNA binding protein, heterogenous nuclear RNP-K like protein [Tulasnella sp. UAMH 9824]|nr:RNA binding protein, heterogenous nuclear RNP-K like protein [Tulasnella sp. UAMH 9824]